MKTALLLLLTTAAAAQNPATPYYPGQVVPQNMMGVAVNSVSAKLAASITAAATSATVDNGAPILVGGYLKIESEYVLVCGKSGNTLQFGKSSCPNVDGRGVDGSAAAAHSRYKTFEGFVPAGGWNQITAEIRAIEQNASSGGSPGGSSSATQYNGSGSFAGDEARSAIVATAIADPAEAPTLATAGTPGSTSYGYAYAWRSRVGVTLASPSATITTGPATLNSTDYVTITPPTCPALTVDVDVYRTSTNGNANNSGRLGTVACGMSFRDMGGAYCDLDGSYLCRSPPTNTTAGVYANGLNVHGHAAFGDTVVDQTKDYYSEFSNAGIVYYDEPPTPGTPSGSAGVVVVRHVPAGSSGAFVGYAQELMTARDNAEALNFLNGTMMFTAHFGTGNVGVLRGFDNNVEVNGSGDVGTVIANINLAQVTGSGNINTLVGVSSSPSHFGTGTIGSMYGFYGDPLISIRPNKVTNAYGLFLNNVTAGANNWAVKTGRGLVQLGDAVQFDAPSGTKPTCSSDIRFRLWTTAGAGGVKDSIEMCAKDDGDAYAWRTVY